MTYFSATKKSEFMGTKTSGSYKYYGYKENGSPKWKIMRKDTSDEGTWQYAYGTSGWSTAWGNPQNESYGDPPD